MISCVNRKHGFGAIGAIELLDRLTKEERLPVKLRIFNVRRALPFLGSLLMVHCVNIDTKERKQNKKQQSDLGWV
jgi:hypothetical protein